MTATENERTGDQGSEGPVVASGAGSGAGDPTREVVVETSESAQVVVDFGDVALPGWGLADLDAVEVSDATAEFYRALLAGLGQPPGGSPSEALRSFRHCHTGDPAGAELTALLLCTDRRLRAAAGTLIRDLEGLGILGEVALDRLAATFLGADAVWLDCRMGWVDPDPTDGDATFPLQRWIRPPLRRWAAERWVRRDYDDAADLVALARDAGAVAGGQVLCGLLDAWDALDDHAEMVLNMALAWSRADVRRRGYEAMAAAGRAVEAQRHAADDPAEAVRRWADELGASLAGAGEATPPRPRGVGAGSGRRPAGGDDEPAAPAQGRLFT